MAWIWERKSLTTRTTRRWRTKCLMALLLWAGPRAETWQGFKKPCTRLTSTEPRQGTMSQTETWMQSVKPPALNPGQDSVTQLHDQRALTLRQWRTGKCIISWRISISTKHSPTTITSSITQLLIWRTFERRDWRTNAISGFDTLRSSSARMSSKCRTSSRLSPSTLTTLSTSRNEWKPWRNTRRWTSNSDSNKKRNVSRMFAKVCRSRMPT